MANREDGREGGGGVQRVYPSVKIPCQISVVITFKYFPLIKTSVRLSLKPGAEDVTAGGRYVVQRRLATEFRMRWPACADVVRLR